MQHGATVTAAALAVFFSCVPAKAETFSVVAQWAGPPGSGLGNPDISLTVFSGSLIGAASNYTSAGGYAQYFSATSGGAYQVYSAIPPGPSLSDMTRYKKNLYGVAKGAHSVIYKWNPSGSTPPQILHTLSSQEGCSAGPLSPPTVFSGKLYIVADSCGANGYGTILRLDPGSGGVTVVHSFSAGSEGRSPYGRLVAYAGKLYGTTAQGGTGLCGSGCGTIYSLDPDTGAVTTLYSFQGDPDGHYPYSGLVALADGKLYGTTYYGGAGGNGTVYVFDPVSGTERVLYSFTRGADGYSPSEELTYFHKNLYGTAFGGDSSCGTAWRINPQTGAFHLVHSFAGDCIYRTRLRRLNGNLYGTALLNSATQVGGEIFSIGTGAPN